jgi:hypothetical protein
MALKKTITLFGDIEVNNAYLRVEDISIFEKTKLVFSIVGRKTPESQIINSNSHNCNYNINGDNPIKQAYLHLKTFPEFADAVDC